MNEPITNKEQMYRLLIEGRFGNRARMWDSWQALLDSGYRGLVSMRSKETSNPVRLYHVPFEELADRIANLPDSQRRAGLVFSEAPDDQQRVIQGELMRDEGGLRFAYTFVPLPMRLAFEQQRGEASGLQAKLLLEHYLDARDYNHLYELLEEYPDHVIEFSTFRIPIGTMNRRTIIWELRFYTWWLLVGLLAVLSTINLI